MRCYQRLPLLFTCTRSAVFFFFLRNTSERGHGDAACTHEACSIYSVTRFIDLKSSIISHQTCNVFSNPHLHLHLHPACWIRRQQLHNPFSKAVLNPNFQVAYSNIFYFLCWIHVLTPRKFLNYHFLSTTCGRHFLTHTLM